MHARKTRFATTVLLGAMCAGCASPALVTAPLDPMPPGWTSSGLGGGDEVGFQQGGGNTPILVIKRKSPYQQDKLLQVYKHFPGETLRGKRIRMSYGVAMRVDVPDRRLPTGVPPAGLFVTRVQCNISVFGPRVIYTSRMPINTDGAESRWMNPFEFNIPSDAGDCAVGWDFDRPMVVMIAGIKFEQVDLVPAAKPGAFPLPASTSGLPALELSAPAGSK